MELFFVMVIVLAVQRQLTVLCELRFGSILLSDGTFLSDGPDFHHRAIGQTRTVFGDGHRLVETVHLKQEVTANRFLGFRKRAIGNHPPILSGNDLTLVFQRVSSAGLALPGQPVEPAFPLACDLLHFFRREAFVPVSAAKYQHVSFLCLCAHYFLSFCWLSVLLVQ